MMPALAPELPLGVALDSGTLCEGVQRTGGRDQ